MSNPVAIRGPNTTNVPSTGPIKGKSPMPVSSDELDACVICLSPLEHRAVTYPCNHLSFDFHCLTAWLRHRPDCPLCNTPVQRVEYDWRSPTEHKTWHVPWGVDPRRCQNSIVRRGHPRSSSAPSSSSSSSSSLPVALPPAAVVVCRKLIYARALRSLHRAPAVAPLTPVRFRTSVLLQRRARLFLRRELQVFDFIETTRRREWVLGYIVQMLAKLEVKGADGGMERLVAEVLGRGAAGVLCHELRAWLEANLGTLKEWDALAQYADVEVMKRLDYGRDC